MEVPYDYLFKILLIGDSGVGKTSLLFRYVDGVFNPEFQSTIGVDFKITTLGVDGRHVKMQLWDTAGQDRFRNIVASYYRGAHGIVLVYDVSNPQSFESIQTWLDEATVYLHSEVPKLLVGNKIDQPQREVSTEVAEAFATKHGMDFIETSAKSEFHVKELFEQMVRGILGKLQVLNIQPVQKGESVKPATKKLNKGFCCSSG